MGIYLFDDALTSGSAMVSKTYSLSGMYGVGEKNSKGFGNIRHPEAKPKDLKRFFATAQNDEEKHMAFTLAEVLITLGIIGVVAAMTIPTLIANYQEKQTVTALKKAFSTLSQAYKMATIENGVASGWSYPDNTYDASVVLFEKLQPYMRFNKTCVKEEGCMADGYTLLDGNELDDYGSDARATKAILPDGMGILFYSYGNNYKTRSETEGFDSKNWAVGTAVVDVNGLSGPNVAGRDLFTFIITDNGIVPYGYPGLKYKAEDEDGNEIRVEDPLSNCNRTKCFGYCESCTAWVIENANLDYLHCDDLSWDGKRKCSD